MSKLDLLYKATENVTFYTNTNDLDSFYAEFENRSGVIVFAPIDSKVFKGYLLNAMDNVADHETPMDVNTAVRNLNLLLSTERDDHPCVDLVGRRTITNKSAIEYDLQNSDRETVKIDSTGWTISPQKQKFIRGSTNLPQKTPIRTNRSPLELLAPFVNLFGDSFLLFVIWLIQAFTTCSHHALLIFAERGSGKSTLSKLIKKIVDPHSFSVTDLSTKKDDLFTLLSNSSLCCFDNVSKIPPDISDIFCAAITSTAVAKRSLYTNNDLNILNLHNTIVINGIGVVPEKDDLAERMLFLNLKKLSSSNLKPEAEVWQDFEDALPEILGSIFNTLSIAMHKINDIEATNLPRMADSFMEMLAIAKALDISEEEFRRIYDKNKNELEQARAGSPLVTAIREYMADVPGRKVIGKANVIYTEIYNAFSGDKSLLPNSAPYFSKALDKEHSNLLNAGFRVNLDDTGAKSTEITIIKRKK